MRFGPAPAPPAPRRGSPAAVAVVVLAVLLSGLTAAAVRSAAATGLPGTYQNPLSPLDTPDSDVIDVGGTYYSYSTGDYLHNISLMSTTNLASWPQTAADRHFTDAFPCLSGKPPNCSLSLWGSHTSSHAPWAPSVVDVAGTYDLFYAAWDGAVSHYCIGVAKSPSPAGPFKDASLVPLVCQITIGGSIDPSAYLDPAGNLYLTWKNNDGFGSTSPATLWASLLTTGPLGLQLSGPTVSLVTQDQPWETTIENPAMAQLSGQYILFFSGGLWNTSSYAVGYATCQGPLGPCSTPLTTPIFQSAGPVAGPGAPSIFTDTAGTTWMAYDAWSAPKVGYPAGGFRTLRIDPLCLVGTTPVILGPSSTRDTLAPTCPTALAEGYQLVANDGGIFSYQAPFAGSMGGQPLAAPIVGMAAACPSGGGCGYWEVASDGGIFAFGDASFLGSMGGKPLNAPIAGMAALGPSAGVSGYWEVASDGGIFAFGDAGFHGSMGGKPLAKPIVGIAATPDGGGYWEVASDGGIFAFGDAPFNGSMGGKPLAKPVVGIAADCPSGGVCGYWEVASDGGIFAFGDAGFHGSMGGQALVEPIVGIAPTYDGLGYWEVASDGGIFCFGDAPFNGSAGGIPLAAPVVGMAPSRA